MPHPESYCTRHAGNPVDSYKDVLGTFRQDDEDDSAKTWSQPQAVRRVLKDTENTDQWASYDVILALVWRLDMEMDRSERLMKKLEQLETIAARGKG